MATRQIKELKVDLIKNIPFVSTIVGKIVIANECRIDDSIGPIFKLDFQEIPVHSISIKDGKETIEREWDPSPFVQLEIKCWDASYMQLKGCVYQRSLFEYESFPDRPSIYRRYRRPFTLLERELTYGNPESEYNVYLGNPNLLLIPGDSIEIWMLSPWKLNMKKSEIILEVMELRGHIGPTAIKIDGGNDISTYLAFWSDDEYIKYYSQMTRIKNPDVNMDELKNAVNADVRRRLTGVVICGTCHRPIAWEESYQMSEGEAYHIGACPRKTK